MPWCSCPFKNQAYGPGFFYPTPHIFHRLKSPTMGGLNVLYVNKQLIKYCVINTVNKYGKDYHVSVNLFLCVFALATIPCMFSSMVTPGLISLIKSVHYYGGLITCKSQP